MSNIQADLAKLRQEAEKYENYQCELAAKRLFLALSTSDMLLIVTEHMMNNYLPTFERYYPEITWVSEFLTLVSELEPIDYQLHKFEIWDAPIYDEHKNARPGAHAFAQAWQYLQSAHSSHLHNEPKFCADLVGTALTCTIHALIEVYAVRQCPDLWNLRQAHSMDNTRPDEMSSERQLEITTTFSQLRECTRDHFRNLWLDVAADIERSWSRNGSLEARKA